MHVRKTKISSPVKLKDYKRNSEVINRYGITSRPTDNNLTKSYELRKSLQNTLDLRYGNTNRNTSKRRLTSKDNTIYSNLNIKNINPSATAGNLNKASNKKNQKPANLITSFDVSYHGYHSIGHHSQERLNRSRDQPSKINATKSFLKDSSNLLLNREKIGDSSTDYIPEDQDQKDVENLT